MGFFLFTKVSCHDRGYRYATKKTLYTGIVCSYSQRFSQAVNGMPLTPSVIGQPITVGEDASHIAVLLDAIYGGLQVEI
jgi:hypothetical protein